jgi:superfamily II DNA helicase RecQ
MNIKVFTIRLDSAKIEADQNSLNQFLETVEFKKSSSQFVEAVPNYWSVLVHYEPKKASNSTQSTQPETLQFIDLTDKQKEIYQALRQWRTDKSAKLDMKSYLLCHNSELMNIAIKQPTNLEELKRIKGFGDRKTERFGDDIVAVLNAF